MSMTSKPRAGRPAGMLVRPLAAALALSLSATALADPLTHFVTSCSDAAVSPVCDGIDDGTLRKAFVCAMDGDTVDLTQVACSKITLAAPLTSGPVGLRLIGPGANYLEIDAAGISRALVHNGRPGDEFYVSGLTISNGHYVNPYTYGGGGGCVFSSGDVYLSGTLVTGCSTAASGTVASGGAIYAKGSATLVLSTVSGNTAAGSADTKYAAARGGGIAADDVRLYASIVSDNTALSPTKTTYGGGVYARSFTAKYSTVSGNHATARAGVAAAEAFTLSSSTLSGNVARDFDGGAHLNGNVAYVTNSTIAFNSAGADGTTGGISGPALLATNSIIARNTANGVLSDVATLPGGFTGSHDIVEASTVAVPFGTIVANPGLGPLADNGGFTPTHAPLGNSPAIDAGITTSGLDYDQRFDQRVYGLTSDIGSVELDRLFASGFQPVPVEIER